MIIRTQEMPEVSFSRSFRLIQIFLVSGLMLMFAIALPSLASFQPGISSHNVISVLNRDRKTYDLAPLNESAELTRAAQVKAQDILKKGYFAHVSPEGLLPWDFIRDQGFAYQFAGENLAINYTNSLELENAFLNSPHHRENLLSPLFSQIGVAVVEGQYHGQLAVITVQMFALPALSTSLETK